MMRAMTDERARRIGGAATAASEPAAGDEGGDDEAGGGTGAGADAADALGEALPALSASRVTPLTSLRR